MNGRNRANRTRRAVVAAVIGNAFEWYDFILYALFARFIAATFFPARSELTSLLMAVGTFGAGFVLRPLGALVLGQFADRRGRRVALTAIIAQMTLATALLTFTPGYARIGLLAPLLIVASRLLQGFSVGGELGSSTALLLESAPPGRRGVYGSWQASSQLIAALAAALAGAAVSTWLSPAVLHDWGWRLPFAAGLLIGPVGLYLRATASIPNEGLAPESAPLHDLWTGHRGQVLRVAALVSLGTAVTYLMMLNMPAYAQRELGLSPQITFLSGAISTTVGIIAAPLFGALSDRIGARGLLIAATVVTGVTAYPAFMLLTVWPTPLALIAVQSAAMILLGMGSGPVYALIGALFPAGVRSSGLSVGYNIGVLIFGGFAPFICTALIALTGDRRMPAIYLSIAAVFSLAALTIGWPDPASGAILTQATQRRVNRSTTPGSTAPMGDT